MSYKQKDQDDIPVGGVRKIFEGTKSYWRTRLVYRRNYTIDNENSILHPAFNHLILIHIYLLPKNIIDFTTIYYIVSPF